MIDEENTLLREENLPKLKDFFLDFQNKFELSEQKLQQRDLMTILKDLLSKFPFLRRHLKENLDIYPLRKPRPPPTKPSVLSSQLQSLKAELLSLKTEEKGLAVRLNEAFGTLLRELADKFNEVLQRESSEKQGLKRELIEILEEKARLSEDLRKYHSLEEEKREVLRSSQRVKFEEQRLELERRSLEKIKEEFSLFEAEKRGEMEKEMRVIQEEQKRLENLRNLVLMNDDIQKNPNSSFSFQNSEERPQAPFSNVTTNRKEKKHPQKSRFSAFKTPDRLSPGPGPSSKSQRKGESLLNKSLIEGLMFIHERDEDSRVFDEIKELGKRPSSVKKEDILSHVLKDKTRVKKKLNYARDVLKLEKQKKAGLNPKSAYRDMRKKSLEKATEVVIEKLQVKKTKVEELAVIEPNKL